MRQGKILIADDETDIRELLGDFLEGEGYKCILAQDAFEAKDKFLNEKDIDLVMSDIRMPGKTGLELLSELKEIDPDIMVVMISAVKDIESAISAMSKGAYDYVSKPFKLTEVKLIAIKAIEKRRLLNQNKEYQKRLEIMVEERTKELENALKELDSTYNFTLRALVTALDTRDEETQGHSSRVVRFTMKLAELMNVNDDKLIKVIEYGSLLHDIGKIGIPDAILRKPDKLTAEEWTEMKKHPVIGYNILHKIRFLEEAAQMVLHHHEKFDGTGYPSGLKGEKIPVGSRIFAVADTVDAMTSDRPYRRALTFEKAAEELIKFSGSQFDPDVVSAFNLIDLSEWKEEKERINRQFNKNSILI